MGLIRGAGATDKGKDRGGAGALRAALKALREHISGMTTDIPPGPASIAGLGIVTLARMSGRPIVPCAGDEPLLHSAHLEPPYHQPAVHEARDGGGRSDPCAARCQRGNAWKRSAKRSKRP